MWAKTSLARIYRRTEKMCDSDSSVSELECLSESSTAEPMHDHDDRCFDGVTQVTPVLLLQKPGRTEPSLRSIQEKIIDATSNMKSHSKKAKLPNIIRLNVGGHFFMTRLSTLCKYEDSMLSAMFSGRHQLDCDEEGRYFIDSDGTHFSHILEYLRHDVFPPKEVALEVYKEATYYNLHHLADKLQTSPLVARQTVKESHRSQFPGYQALKNQVIRVAMDGASMDKVGEVIVHAFRKRFTPRLAHFNVNHECVADQAHINMGPWDSPADEEILIRCLETDLVEEGFNIKPHEQRRRCKYYNGQNCQKCIYKLTFIFK